MNSSLSTSPGWMGSNFLFIFIAFISSVIINYFYFTSVGSSPYKTNSPLIIYSNTVLPLSISLQRFQLISRGHTQVSQQNGGVQHIKLSPSHSFKRHKSQNALLRKKRLRVLAFKRFNHTTNIARTTYNVQRTTSNKPHFVKNFDCNTDRMGKTG